MTDVTLHGLPADQFAAAMATFGLYAAVDDCKIRFDTPDGRRYFPVISSGCKKVEDLAAILSDYKTWEKLGLTGGLEALGTTASKLTVDGYASLYDINPVLASGLATDAIRRTIYPKPKKKDEGEDEEEQEEEEVKEPITVVARSPLFCLKRQAKVSDELIKLLESLTPEAITTTFTNERTWAWERSSQTFGLHSQFETGSAFRNPSTPPKPKKAKKGEKKEDLSPTKRRVAILTMLYIASWRLFTVFPSYKDSASAVGFNDMDFYYPVFSRSLDVEGFKALMVNPYLPKFGRYRKGFAAMGVPVVYKTTKRGLGMKDEPHFTEPIAL